VILAVVLLLLAAFGLLPLDVAAPLAAVSVILGMSGLYLLQRRLRRVPVCTGREGMIGALVPAISRIDRDGEIRYGSEIWRARTIGAAVGNGDTVRILRVEGLRAIVAPAESDAGG